MKNLILFPYLFSIIQLTWAQTKITDISQLPLKGKVKRVTTYTFRSANNREPDTTAIVERSIETFDKKGLPIEEKNFGNNDFLADKFRFEFIGDSIIIKNQIDNEGKLLVKYVYKYDAQGKETEFDMQAEAQPKFRLAAIDYRCLLKYDESGNRVSEEQYINKNQITFKTTSVYNSFYQKIQSVEQSFSGNKTEETKIIYTYDENGNEIKSETFDHNGNLTWSQNSLYGKIDNYGNWLKSTSKRTGHNPFQGDYTFVNITKRIIEYY